MSTGNAPHPYTQFPEIWAALAAPFEDWQVRQRKGGGNKMLDFITARTAMNRLDEVVGPENWSNAFKETKDGIMCQITVTLPDGRTVTKGDGGGFADMPEEDNTEKSGYSDAFKRACVEFGIARYLYRDGVPRWIGRMNGGDGMDDRGNRLSNVGGSPAPSPAPAHNGNGNGAPPRSAPPSASPAPAPRGNGNGNGGGNGDAALNKLPTSGRGMFAWSKDMGQKYEVDLLRYVSQWAKIQGFGDRMVDWDGEQVRLAHAEAVRKVNAMLAEQKGEAYEEALSN